MVWALWIAVLVCVFWQPKVSADDSQEEYGEEICEKSDEFFERSARQECLEQFSVKTIAEADKLYSLGRYDDAIDLLERSISRLSESDSPELRAELDNKLGHIAADCGHLRLKNAANAFVEAAEIYEEYENWRLSYSSYILAADLYVILWDLESAEACYHKSISVADRITNEKGCVSLPSIAARNDLLRFYELHGRNLEATELAETLANLGKRKCPVLSLEDLPRRGQE